MPKSGDKPGVSLWRAIELHLGHQQWAAVLERKKGGRGCISGAWSEIRQKLLSGDLHATGCGENLLNPQPIAPEVWELRWEPATNLPVPGEASIVELWIPKQTRRITGVRIHGRLPSPGARAQRDCAEWLRGLFQTDDAPRVTRDVIFAEAKWLFPDLSERGFKQAWKAEAPPERKRGGRRSSRNSAPSRHSGANGASINRES